MKINENIRSAVCHVLNLRRKIGLLTQIKMYPKLARELVKQGDWYMIPLSSGMQTPIIDAILYLCERKDTESVPILEKLVKRYSPDNKKDKQTFSFGGGTVTILDGPVYYIPEQIHKEANRALKVLKNEKAACA